jgi:hypothetical protein
VVVARRSRLIDVVSLLLILGGFALYVRAYLGMERIRTSPDVPFVRGTMEVYALTNAYWRLQKLSYVALGLVGVGIAVGLSAAAHHHKIRRGATSSTQSIT